MKIQILFAFLMLSVALCAQDEKPSYPENWTYSNVVQVDSASASVLYHRAKETIANLFVSGKTVTDLDDPATYTIIIKPIMEIPSSFAVYNCASYVSYTLKIECKDGRYKYTFSNYSHSVSIGEKCGSGGSLILDKPACGSFNMMKSSWNKIKDTANFKTIMLISSLKKSMAGSAAKSDW